MKTPNILLISFLIIVGLTGGGSRSDILSLTILRPASFVTLGACMLFVTREQLREIRIPMLLLIALAAWMCIQLLPLPPAIWQRLPGRGIYTDIGRAIGMGDVWRPISLSPAKTLNSLLSLGVAAAAMLLFAIQPLHQRNRLVFYLIALAAFSAMLGAAQMITKIDALFLYAITNVGQPVGLFANQNHQAVFLASALFLTFGELGAMTLRVDKLGPGGFALAIASALLLTISFLAGSRFGLLIAGLAIMSALYFLRHSRLPLSIANKNSCLFVSIGAAAIGAVVFYVFVIRNSVAVDQVAATSLDGELRYNLLPVLLKMASQFAVFGVGFGAFYKVYPQWEPVSNLSTNYLNNAHNDWLQLVIEGGMPAVLIGIILITWICRRCFILLNNEGSIAVQNIAAPLLVILAFIGASAVDYPLRVPIIMMFLTFIICIFAVRSNSNNSPIKT